MKKTIAPALVLGVLFSLLIAAGATAGPGPRMRHHGHGGHMVGMLVKHLDLTEAQKAQVEQLHEKMRVEVEPLRKEQKELAETVHTALENNADAATVGAAVIAVHQQHEKIRAIHDQHATELEAILTPEQLARWNSLKESHKSMRPRHGFGFGFGH